MSLGFGFGVWVWSVGLSLGLGLQSIFHVRLTEYKIRLDRVKM